MAVPFIAHLVIIGYDFQNCEIIYFIIDAERIAPMCRCVGNGFSAVINDMASFLVKKDSNGSKAK